MEMFPFILLLQCHVAKQFSTRTAGVPTFPSRSANNRSDVSGQLKGICFSF